MALEFSELPSESSLLEKIRDGVVSLPDDYASISRSISKAEEDSRRCGEEITRVTAQKADIDRRVYLSKAFINPIRSFPAEVLSIVFRYTCCFVQDLTLADMETLREGVIQDAFSISHVCRFWRKVALALPELWSSIVINYEHLTGHLCQVIDLYLTRSLDRKLLLTLYYDPDAHRRVDPRYRVHIQESLYRHRDRIFELALFGADPFTLQGVRPHFPELETLSLHYPQWENDNESENFFWLVHSSELYKLDLAHYSDQPVLLPELPHDIEHVTVRERTPFAAICALEDYELVTDLVVVLDEGHMQSLAPSILEGSERYFDDLECLEITISDEIFSNSLEYPITQFLQLLTTPVLTSLELRSLPDAKWDHQHFIEFLLRSNITLSLTTLALAGPPITEGELLQTLDILPSLEDVHLEEWFDREAVLTKEVLSRLVALPKLVFLCLSLDHGALDMEDVDLFAQMKSKPMRRVYLDVHRREPMDEDVASRLHGLQSDIVTLEYCDSCEEHL